MAAVVASKVKRKRQLALEGKNPNEKTLAESQLIQRRQATASKEAAEKRKAAQYYRQVELLPREKQPLLHAFYCIIWPLLGFFYIMYYTFMYTYLHELCTFLL